MSAAGVTELVSEAIGDSFEKKQLMADKLQKRQEERLAELQRKKDEKSLGTSTQETAKFFIDNFAKEKKDLEIELAKCDSLDKQYLVDKFDALSIMHQKLQRFLTESTIFLPSYDVKQSQEALTKLHIKIQEKRDELLPKKKFAFKSKKKGNTTELPVEQPTIGIVDFENVALADCKLADLKDQKLEMGNEINLKDVALANLESCIVKLHGTPSAIHINKLNNCVILSGPVSGSVFIRECQSCTFVVACQQLRIHTTTDTKFYIHVTSKAIIEDSSRVEFAPYNWTYPEIEKHYKLAGLDHKRNNWSDIDDFNWLAADKHSPNWSLIPKQYWLYDWD